MKSFQIRLRFDLGVAFQLLQPHIQQLIHTSGVEAVTDQARRMWKWRRCKGPASEAGPIRFRHLIDEPKPAHDTIERQIFAAWVLYFLQRQCYVMLPTYLEEIWQTLFLDGSADFLNAARVETNRLLYPLYWATSPAGGILINDGEYLHGVELTMKGHLLTLTLDRYVEPNTIPGRRYDRLEELRGD